MHYSYYVGINIWEQEQEIESINTDRPDQNIIYLLV